MKFCEKCGKQLSDDAVFCSGCGNRTDSVETAPEQATQSEQPAQEAQAIQPEQVKQTKPIKKGKVIKVTIAVVAALLLIVGGVFGYLLINCNMRANELEAQLVGKTFEFNDTAVNSQYYTVCWYTFQEDGQCRVEAVYGLGETQFDYTNKFTVNVNLDGTETLYIGESLFEFVLDSNGNIESLLEHQGEGRESREYIPFHKKEDLSSWFLKFKYQKELEANKAQALELFASCTQSNWGSGYSFNNLIPIIFESYELTCEPQGTTNNEFIITVSGNYYPNKVDLSWYTVPGELTCHVTIGLEESVMKIVSDDGIVDAMDLYVILRRYG